MLAPALSRYLVKGIFIDSAGATHEVDVYRNTSSSSFAVRDVINFEFLSIRKWELSRIEITMLPRPDVGVNDNV